MIDVIVIVFVASMLLAAFGLERMRNTWARVDAETVERENAELRALLRQR